MSDDLKSDVHNLKVFAWGDQSDPSGWPGAKSELTRMGMEQARTNEILTELRDAAKWIVGLSMGGIVTAILGIILKYHA